MVQIGGKVGGQVIRHAVKLFERFKQCRRLFVNRFDAHDRAGRPLDILRKLDHAIFDDGGNAHAGDYNERMGRSRES